MPSIESPRPVRQRRLNDERGYTLLEMVVSVGIMMVVTGAVFQMAGSSQSAFRVQPEVADMQQRLRVAADMIYKDLLMAGAGPYQAPTVGALSNYFPPIRPTRRGVQYPTESLSCLTLPAAQGCVTDRISILYVPTTRSQTVLSATMATAGADVPVGPSEPGCPTGGLCGFATNTPALLFDTTGVGAGYELFTVTGTAAGVVKHAGPNVAFTKPYAQGSRLIEVDQHVYYLDSTTHRLMHYNGHQSDVPLVDNVAALQFAYFADSDPNSVPKPVAGANCVYDAGTPPVPKLAVLAGGALVRLTQGDLTSGATCGVGTNQFDGDLLRVRKVKVTIRVRPTSEKMRGVDNADGLREGGGSLVPDYVMSFEVAPRNMNLIR